MKIFQTLLIIIFFLIGTQAFSDDYYSWEDENGAITISNMPPPDNVKKFKKAFRDESDQGSAPMNADIKGLQDENEPPPLAFSAPPELVVIPGGNGYVYMVPDLSGLYFYQDAWYRFYGGRWFRSNTYDGAWVLTGRTLVPSIVTGVPPEYPRYMPSGYYRIPYDDFRRSWRFWARDKHWHRYDWYKYELRAEIRRERLQSNKAARSMENRAVSGKSASGITPLQTVKKSGEVKPAVKANRMKPSRGTGNKIEHDAREQKAHSSPAQQEKQRKP